MAADRTIREDGEGIAVVIIDRERFIPFCFSCTTIPLFFAPVVFRIIYLYVHQNRNIDRIETPWFERSEGFRNTNQQPDICL